MITVLHYISGLADIKAGVESYILNTYEKLPHNQYRFCVLTRNAKTGSPLNRLFLESGIEIFEIPCYTLRGSSYKQYIQDMKCFFQEHYGEFDFIHMHGCDDPFVLKMAKKYGGIKRAAVHVHSITRENPNCFKTFLRKCSSCDNIRNADFRFACSDTAGKKFFTNLSYMVLPNTIDTEKYRFSATNREYYRKKYGLRNEQKAICFCGRFSKIKNLEFLVDVFFLVQRRYENVFLFLIGDGEERSNLEKAVAEYHIEDKVVFTGETLDIQSILSAMDIYVQTSLNEGFSISALEAQCSGLPTLISNGFPDEIMLTDIIRKLPISGGKSVWVEEICNELSTSKNLDRDRYWQEIKSAGYDSSLAVKYVDEVYRNVKTF